MHILKIIYMKKTLTAKIIEDISPDFSMCTISSFKDNNHDVYKVKIAC